MKTVDTEKYLEQNEESNSNEDGIKHKDGIRKGMENTMEARKKCQYRPNKSHDKKSSSSRNQRRWGFEDNCDWYNPKKLVSN